MLIDPIDVSEYALNTGLAGIAAVGLRGPSRINDDMLQLARCLESTTASWPCARSEFWCAVCGAAVLLLLLLNLALGLEKSTQAVYI